MIIHSTFVRFWEDGQQIIESQIAKRELIKQSDPCSLMEHFIEQYFQVSEQDVLLPIYALIFFYLYAFLIYVGVPCLIVCKEKSKFRNGFLLQHPLQWIFNEWLWMDNTNIYKSSKCNLYLWELYAKSQLFLFLCFKSCLVKIRLGFHKKFYLIKYWTSQIYQI